MKEHRPTEPMDHDDVAREIAAAGPLTPIDESRFQALRPGLEGAWRKGVRRTAAGRRRRRMAWAATLLLLVGGSWLWRNTRGSGSEGRTTEPVARLTALDGHSVPERSLAVGEVLETGEERWALRTADGHRFRLDRGSRVVAEGRRRWRLEAGAIFVDAAEAELEIVTELGRFRHIGTRFEVRVVETGVRVQVRSGTVRWEGRTAAEVEGGRGLRIGRDGSSEDLVVPIDDRSWRWIRWAAAPLEGPGRPISEVIQQLAEGSGWRLSVESAIEARWDDVAFRGETDGSDAASEVVWVARSAGWTARLSDGVLTLTSEAEE